MSSPEPIVFVPDPYGQEHIWDGKEHGPFIPVRRLPPGWLAEAVGRQRKMLHEDGYHLTDQEADRLAAALFPPPEPEPEEWEREAALAWAKSLAQGEWSDEEYAKALARHFAKARRERGKP